MAMAVPPPAAFELPDTIAALPRRPFHFSAAAFTEADALVAQPPEALFRRLLADQESEAAMLAARRVLDAFLTGPAAGPASSADELDGDLWCRYSDTKGPPLPFARGRRGTTALAGRGS
jgi:hypothetical protein